MRPLLLSICVASLVASLVSSLAIVADPIEDRSKDVSALFRDKPDGYESLFHPTFLKAVPAKQLDPIFIDVHKKLGECKGVEITERVGPRAAKVNFVFDGWTVPGKISVDAGEKHLIDGLFIQPPVATVKDFDAILKALRALPGTCGFLIVKLGGEKDVVMASLNPDRPLAIGSTFKLYILAELVRQIEKGERHWEDVVKLDAKAMSLPSGNLHAWPVGSPITLHTLASLMISQSDNTATDQLLRIVGREKVEAILSPAGNKHAAQSTPFLSTLEMFKLHSNPGLGDEYVKADVSAKRKLLDGKIASGTVDISGITAAPGQIDKIEWFASAADLCRTMDYLRKHTETGPGAEARKILAINPGLEIDKSRFPVICYKGGSEAGVLNLTYLLQSKSGQWYALSAGWNNPKAAVDENKLFTAISQSFRLLP